MSKIGYARVSSTEQNLGRQIERLEEAGCDKIFSEKKSGKSKNRPELKKMIEYIREGDIVVITELDRLSRKYDDSTYIMNKIQDKGATLEILNLPSTQGIENESLRKLINNIIIELYKYQAELERDNIKQKQAEGIALAKEQDKYKGRKALFDRDDPKLNHAFDLYKEGYSIRDIERLTGINRETFRNYRDRYGITRD